MGKASRWLRLLLGSKKSQSSSSESSPVARDKDKTTFNSRWGLAKSSNTNDRLTWSCEDPSSSPYIEKLDANKHAIAVAAATAAVAEAALAAAQAAAEVVRLTSGDKPVAGTRTVSKAYAGGGNSRERQWELAATKIQSAFRAYLARRALRALKGLVKLQALVRGRMVRKQSADMLRRMQAMVRIQARACANRSHISGSPHSHLKFSEFHHSGTTALKRYDIDQHSSGIKHVGPNLKRGGSRSSFNDSINMENLPLDSSWLDRWMEESTLNHHRETSFKNLCLEDEKSDKILEIDTWKPHYNPRRSDKTFQTPEYFSAWKDHGKGTPVFDPISGLSHKLEKPNPSVSSGDVTSLRSLKFPSQEDQVVAWTAENSPCVRSASSRPGGSSSKGPFPPGRSEYSRSLFGDFVGHRNYMANTESSLAKVRSQSAPRQRMESEKRGTGRKFVHVLWDAETNSENGSTVQSNFRSKAYPGSGCVDRLETPIQDGAAGFRMTYHDRR